jgi:hypothetical protein
VRRVLSPLEELKLNKVCPKIHKLPSKKMHEGEMEQQGENNYTDLGSLNSEMGLNPPCPQPAKYRGKPIITPHRSAIIFYNDSKKCCLREDYV